MKIWILTFLLFLPVAALALDEGQTKATLVDNGNGNYEISCSWDGNTFWTCADHAKSIDHIFLLDGSVKQTIRAEIGHKENEATVKTFRITGAGQVGGRCVFSYHDHNGVGCPSFGDKTYTENAPQSFSARQCYSNLDCSSGFVCSGNSCISDQPISSSSCSGRAIIFEHVNYGGACLGLSSDDSSFLDNNLSPDNWNDDASSLKVQPGWDLTLFQNINYGGSSRTFSSDNPNLVSSGINDWASSAKVESQSSCPSGQVSCDGACRAPFIGPCPNGGSVDACTGLCQEEEGTGLVRYSRDYQMNYTIKISMKDTTKKVLTAEGLKDYALSFLVKDKADYNT